MDPCYVTDENANGRYAESGGYAESGLTECKPECGTVEGTSDAESIGDSWSFTLGGGEYGYCNGGGIRPGEREACNGGGKRPDK